VTRKRATCVVHLNSCKLIKLKYGQALPEGDEDANANADEAGGDRVQKRRSVY